MRNLTVIKVEPGKSSAGWTKVKSKLRVLFNWCLLHFGEIIPFTQKKQFFYRCMGVRIGKNVEIMPNIALDIFFPEMTEIGDGTVIGISCFLTCHEFNPGEFRYGPIKIGKNVLIGARSFVLPGVTIGDGAMVSAQTVVYKDIPPNVIAFGSPLVFKEIEKNKKCRRKPPSEG